MTSNELAIVFFPIGAALFIGAVVWAVTANAARKSRIKQATRAKAKRMRPPGLEPLVGIVMHNDEGTWLKPDVLEKTTPPATTVR